MASIQGITPIQALHDAQMHFVMIILHWVGSCSNLNFTVKLQSILIRWFIKAKSLLLVFLAMPSEVVKIPKKKF
jgi:hypothetical protein